MYEVKIVKSAIEHREPSLVGFFILYYDKLRTLELYYKFFWSTLRPQQSWTTQNGYRFILFGFGRRNFRWMYPSQRASKMDWKAKQGLLRRIQSRWKKNYFFPVLAALTYQTWQERTKIFKERVQTHRNAVLVQ